MIALLGRPDPATTQAIQFARGILEGSATAFYEVDGSLTLNRFVLSSNVPPSFHDQYLAGMNRLDPLHPRSASNRPIARLSVALSQCATQEAATYRAFAGQCGVADMIEFFFRRNDRIVAGMSVLWAPGCAIPDGSMHIAEKIHDYLEFNLTSRLSNTDEPARYGLTSREMEVVELLCCGRTNREIGECLNIGLATVKTHLIHIFEKLGVETRSAVVAMMSRPH
ncbi:MULTISPECIES: LuxR C-terminal-related transcriptional regulator [Bradyrhizobium]|jgi:ATP/maltotriose-dependent transcriptional regulator MalT|uniref:helix-turn-helix transcriptional regulator n=1 Tax=Bradyrhizobium TaxID=374 RepID=UPI00041BD78F|nr:MULTISPECIES: LuxR C-terminal-related transcriptional regulator [Bradyrhizobium]AUC96262.1 DNA-binding response regulator [Bradyrhizobium sp. SK17]KIU45474.1 ATP-dependent transcriptional regulator [Bradyrhizobium elkanii]MBK5650605.1 response regulator transcription factor [Rhizobium sp.]OCX30517.1 helix-turn-helix transcriptional regulator [Bradyrhizobium sp. UASWS1016]